MAEKKGKRLPGIVAAGFLVFAVPTAVLAAGGSGRTENIKSHGVIEYKGQSDTVRIDSSDLVYLAKEIDAVEKADTPENIESSEEADVPETDRTATGNVTAENGEKTDRPTAPEP